MRKSLLGALCAMFLAAACEKTERSGAPDAGGGSDGAADARDGAADVRDAAADLAGDTGRDGKDAAADTLPDAAGDARPDGAASDGGAPDGRAADAPADAPRDVPTGTPDGGDAAAAEVLAPMLITVDFTGAVTTVSGTPLGLDGSIRLARVSGSFTYDLRSGDLTPADPKRSRFPCNGTCAFTFTVGAHTVTGSGLAVVVVENDLPPDTFRFLDGANQTDGITRVMKLDGSDHPGLALSLVISDSSGTMLSSDALPDPFPTIPISSTTQTFSLDDSGGTLLMQLDALTPR